MSDEEIWQYRGLVYAVARKIIASHRANVDFDDLLDEGQVLLLEVGRRWDPDRGIDFTPYVIYHLRFRMIDYIRTLTGRNREKFHLRRPKATDPHYYKFERLRFEEGGFSEIEEKDFVRSLFENPIFDHQERHVMHLFMEGMNHRRVGEALGVSESRVSQILKSIRQKVSYIQA